MTSVASSVAVGKRIVRSEDEENAVALAQAAQSLKDVLVNDRLKGKGKAQEEGEEALDDEEFAVRLQMKYLEEALDTMEDFNYASCLYPDPASVNREDFVKDRTSLAYAIKTGLPTKSISNTDSSTAKNGLKKVAVQPEPIFDWLTSTPDSDDEDLYAVDHTDEERRRANLLSGINVGRPGPSSVNILNQQPEEPQVRFWVREPQTSNPYADLIQFDALLDDKTKALVKPGQISTPVSDVSPPTSPFSALMNLFGTKHNQKLCLPPAPKPSTSSIPISQPASPASSFSIPSSLPDSPAPASPVISRAVSPAPSPARRPSPSVSPVPSFLRSLSPFSPAAGDDSPVSSPPSSRPASPLDPIQLHGIQNGFATIICFVCGDLVVGEPTLQAPCGHDHCVDCVQDNATTATTNEALFPPKCCNIPIPFDDLDPFLTRNHVRALKEKKVEWGIPAKFRIFCPTPTCSVFLGSSEQASGDMMCSSCGTAICVQCKQFAHPDETCGNNTGLGALKKLAQSKKWQQCPHCKSFVEITGGCYHMVCRCTLEFCYLCGAKWKTCRC